jgi:hypothetical protein
MTSRALVALDRSASQDLGTTSQLVREENVSSAYNSI